MPVSRFDPSERAREKAVSRSADDLALRSGSASRAELNRRNFAFGHIDFSKGRLIVGDPDADL